MRKYIDVNNIPFYIRYVTDPEECKTADYVVAFRDEIDNIPAEDVVEVKHGRKVESAISNTGLMCTACFSDIDRDAVFCKYCGAKMDCEE